MLRFNQSSQGLFRALADLASAPKTALPLLFHNSLPAAFLVPLAPVPLQATFKEVVESIEGGFLRYKEAQTAFLSYIGGHSRSLNAS